MSTKTNTLLKTVTAADSIIQCTVVLAYNEYHANQKNLHRKRHRDYRTMVSLGKSLGVPFRGLGEGVGCKI